MLPISNAAIADAVKRHGSVNGAAKALSISWQTVNYALTGRRKGPKAAAGEIENPCTCCGQVPKGKGLRYLCVECYESAECGVIYPETRIVL